MKTVTPQQRSILVDIGQYTQDRSNPIVKVFLTKGQVFGFVAPQIVSEKLNLTLSNQDGIDLLIDEEGLSYKVVTTKDLAPAFTKGFGRSKAGTDAKQQLNLLCDRVCILERPVDGKSILTIFKTTDVILDHKGHIM